MRVVPLARGPPLPSQALWLQSPSDRGRCPLTVWWAPAILPLPRRGPLLRPDRRASAVASHSLSLETLASGSGGDTSSQQPAS